jgi:hypothetical protein
MGADAVLNLGAHFQIFGRNFQPTTFDVDGINRPGVAP